MSQPFFVSFENASYPCYFLGKDGEFWCNPAAGAPDAPDAGVVKELLWPIAFLQQNTPDAELAALPSPGEALFLQGLTVLPVSGGVLALWLYPHEAPASVFSSQLRNPISDIFAVLPMLAKRLEDDSLFLAEDIQRNCYRLLRTVCNLENMSRALKNNYVPQTVELGALVESVCSSANSLCHDLGIPIRWEVPEEPVPVLCDPHLMSEALLNLLRNSLKYTRDNNQIQVRLTTSGSRALLTVDDQGLGIRPEHLDRLFYPYFSADPYGDSDRRPGLGLGLPMVREIARSFGGTVAAESRFGEGTRVSLSFPLDTGQGSVLRSAAADYLTNRFSSVYVQLCGFCRPPGI